MTLKLLYGLSIADPALDDAPLRSSLVELVECPSVPVVGRFEVLATACTAAGRIFSFIICEAEVELDCPFAAES